jgi:hypothetical protein
MSVAKAKSALKRALKSTAQHQFGTAGIEVVRSLTLVAQASASEDDIYSIAAGAQNVLKHITDIADSAARAGRDVDRAATWANGAINDPYFSGVDEFKYNPHRK